MPDSGAVLKFPGGRGDKVEKSIPINHEAPAAPQLDSFSYDETVDLYQIATSVKKKAEDLGTFVDQNRVIARQAGVEMIAVQITSILEGDRFQRVVEALEDAVYRRVPISLTRAGADKVHRLERLISEADASIVQFMTGRRVEPSMGAVQPQAYIPPYVLHGSGNSSDASTWMPVVIIGIAGIVGVIAIIALTSRPREVVEVMPSLKNAKSRKP